MGSVVSAFTYISGNDRSAERALNIIKRNLRKDILILIVYVIFLIVGLASKNTGMLGYGVGETLFWPLLFFLVMDVVFAYWAYRAPGSLSVTLNASCNVLTVCLYLAREIAVISTGAIHHLPAGSLYVQAAIAVLVLISKAIPAAAVTMIAQHLRSGRLSLDTVDVKPMITAGPTVVVENAQ